MSNLKNLSEELLLKLLQNGNVPAFEELYNRYWDKLYSQAYNRLRKPEVAEEIVQDFFTSLWLNRSTISISSSFYNYSYTAIRNLVFKHYQKEYNFRKYSELKLTGLNDSDLSTEQLIELNDLKRALDLEIQNLPPKCKGVYTLSRQEHKTNKEIAAILQISEKTVENHITKALKTLRFSLRDITTLLSIIFNLF